MTTPRDDVHEGLRFALGTLTVLRVGIGRVDRGTAGAAMLWAPAVGAGLGAAAGVVAWAAHKAGTSSLVAAVLAIATLAALTRGLHLDGLADTADGLGSGRAAAEALAVMRASDIGPFGVATLVLTLLLQVSALAGTAYDAQVVAVAAIAGAAGRLPLPWACRHGVPPARPDGLGALVAGTVSPASAIAVIAATLVATAGLAAVTAVDVGRAVVAVALGTLAALALLHRCRSRLGGITGDVLGALVEVSASVALVVLAAT
jgi:adenosylcobinamide-GDP ribazoletransferase